ncbi:hypothetical protein AB0I52_00135 [Streptomyces sp. NPDC050423]|uniref:tetratricopeptide repeat protein n=1 Tax=Streptomyces sp. NPDC050423 TaxID=3155402 RepID=UPI00342DC6F0
MTTADVYSEPCEQLFLAGGLAGVRRTATQRLDEAGPHADLYCRLAVAHASEDDDDHDTEAERAFRKGLALDADHPGLLAGYAELCLRSDSFEYPGRAAGAVELTRRLEELAPDSAENAQLRAAHRWAARGYWEDLRMSAAEGAVRRQARETQSDEIADALRGQGLREARVRTAEAAGARPDDQRAAVLAVTLETLSGPGNGWLRWVARHRAAVWGVSVAFSALTSLLLRTTGVVDGFGPWGLLWMLPMLLADARLSSVRKESERVALARLEARLSGSEETGTAAGTATTADAGTRRGVRRS